ncbi:HAD-IB family hydrolase [Pseudomonas sp. LS44]|uniref:HAD family hydrolase n=1 Tax=Pseudomonas sp. LS44 TaxID=1357074 RepID=UPI00215A31FF|nr:HAD family hydrolase [Pseudomonas sp. LS44]UVE16556.1 HAD-IB family hydrolase [Pseudomonas sp. LS44]
MALAIFALNDTLIDGNCASLWAQCMADMAWVDGESYLAREHELMDLYLRDALALEDYLKFSLSSLVGRTAEEVAFVVEPFVEDVIEPLFHSDAIRCLANHRATGDRILLISASAHFLVSAIAARLGISDVLAIDLEERHGSYSGHTEGELPYREGKLTRLQAWLEEHTETLDGASFYSASHNDLALLSQVSRPHVVNPDASLQEHAKQAKWPILSWR